VVVQCEHLSLLVVLVLLFLLRFLLIETCLLLSLSRLILIDSWLIVLLIEESKVVWVLTFAIARVGVHGIIIVNPRYRILLIVYFQVIHLQLRLRPVRRRPLLITYTLVALVAHENAIVRVIIGGHSNGCVLVVPRLVILADAVIVPESRGCRRDSTQTGDVTAPALQHLVRQHLRGQVLSLTDLRTVLQAIGLLGEEDVSVVVRGLHYFWTGAPVFHVDTEALVRLGGLGTGVELIVSDVGATGYLGGTADLVVEIIMVVFVALRSSVGRPETTEARGIHLLLKQIAIIRIMDVCIILQSLHQILRVVKEITEAGGAPLALSGSTGSAQVLVVSLPIIRLIWLPCIGVQNIRLIAAISDKCSIGVLLHLVSSRRALVHGAPIP